ncbi:MAG: rhamnan synthesis F family protein [Polyangiaceae bacterium]
MSGPVVAVPLTKCVGANYVWSSVPHASLPKTNAPNSGRLNASHAAVVCRPRSEELIYSKMRRIALFAHYDAQAQVKPYILYYLQRLREVCDDVIFISNSPLSEHEIAKTRPICSRVHLRDNVGYDFGMWRDGLKLVDCAEWDEVVLTNSSVFGPIHPLDDVFRRMSEVRCDFWGMTDSTEISWHLQSYFLVFRRKVLDSAAFADFWRGVLPYRDKSQVVRSYEIGLSCFLREQGFVPAAVVPVASVPVPWFRRRKPNPTLAYAETLLRSGMPFVKVELLRDNPFGRPLAAVYLALEAAGYDGSLVVFDRSRLGK